MISAVQLCRIADVQVLTSTPRESTKTVAGVATRLIRVPFQESTVHHVVEHTAGGPTDLGNGVLVCEQCASTRNELQAAEPELKKYLLSVTQARMGSS